MAKINWPECYRAIYEANMQILRAKHPLAYEWQLGEMARVDARRQTEIAINSYKQCLGEARKKPGLTEEQITAIAEDMLCEKMRQGAFGAACKMRLRVDGKVVAEV